jgi:hypothetical protein
MRSDEHTGPNQAPARSEYQARTDDMHSLDGMLTKSLETLHDAEHHLN